MSGYFWYIYFIGDNIFFIRRERARIRLRNVVLEALSKEANDLKISEPSHKWSAARCVEGRYSP